MHGTNEIRKAEYDELGRLQVADVFYTIQGEGPHTGECAVFLRLSGCNLRCVFCDTLWNDQNDPTYAPAQLVDLVVHKMPTHCNLLVITGGEPMRQRLAPFLQEFWKQRPGAIVQIETAGTLWQEELGKIWLDYDLEFVVSPKTPQINNNIHNLASAFKYVIKHGRDDVDGLPLGPTQKDSHSVLALAKPRRGAPVYLSPMDEGDSYLNMLNLHTVRDIALAHGYKAGVQLHKILELP